MLTKQTKMFSEVKLQFTNKSIALWFKEHICEQIYHRSQSKLIGLNNEQ